MRLSDRLETVVSMVRPAESAADIGTDHGHVPVELVRRGTIKRALAELIRQGRVEKQARFRESGGITSNCYRIKVGQAELTDELSRT